MALPLPLRRQAQKYVFWHLSRRRTQGRALKRYDDAEKLLDQGQDPVAVREAKRKEDEKLKHTFRAVGEEWATKKLDNENKPKSTIKRERWNPAGIRRLAGEAVAHRGDHDVRTRPRAARHGRLDPSADRSP